MGRRTGSRRFDGAVALQLVLALVGCERDTSARPMPADGPFAAELRLVEGDPALIDVVLTATRVTFIYASTPQIAVDVGDLLFGERRGGYLRRVARVIESTPTRRTYGTTGAALTELIREGTLRITADSDHGLIDVNRAALREGPWTFDGLSLPLPDADDGPAGEVRVHRGRAWWQPTVDASLTFSPTGLEQMTAELFGPLEVELDATLWSPGPLTFDVTHPLFQGTWPFTAELSDLPSTPLRGQLVVAIALVARGTVDGPGRFESGLQVHREVRTTAALRGEGLWEAGDAPELDESTWGAAGDVDLTVGVEVTTDLRLYNVGGPSFDLTAGIQMSGGNVPYAWQVDAGLAGGAILDTTPPTVRPAAFARQPLGTDRSLPEIGTCTAGCVRGRCEAGMLQACERAETGCLELTDLAACAGGSCASEISCAACAQQCLPPDTRCSDDAQSDCVPDASGCWTWSDPEPCDHAACVDRTACGTCPDECEHDACRDGWWRRCEADDFGCRRWSSPRPCGSGRCGDEHACAVATVASSMSHNCLLDHAGLPACWGWNETGQSDAPQEPLTQVTTASLVSCGRRPDETLVCWGEDTFDSHLPPPGPFASLAAGDNHLCAVAPTGAVTCWGNTSWGMTAAPPGRFVAVYGGARHTCALRRDRSTVCWGVDDYGQSSPPEGPFHSLALGWKYTCGRRFDGTVECWGRGPYGELLAPEGPFTRITGGRQHLCGFRPAGELVCWGAGVTNGGCDIATVRLNCGQSKVPTGDHVDAAAGLAHTCALEASGTVRCWGSSVNGAVNVPSGLRWQP